jgi:hypothetical protein
MRVRKPWAILAYWTVSVSIGFVAVASGLLAASLLAPENILLRAVPVIVGALVAVSLGRCAAWFVQWLTDDGWHSKGFTSNAQSDTASGLSAEPPASRDDSSS